MLPAPRKLWQAKFVERSAPMNSLTRHVYLLLSLAVVLGCRSAEVLVTAPIAASETHAPAQANGAAPAKASGTAARTPDLANPKVTSAHVAEFKPPFPERADLFEAPKRAQSAVRREDEHGQSVELKGFVTVDEPSVVLSIDGVLSTIPEGGEKYGVQVISIQPPNAVLQRGRNRWPVTLE
jgi:hypothetical protein